MARNFYCSKCGIELVHIRKAVPGKGIILDLIEPHECEGYAIHSAFDDKPTAIEIIESAKPTGELSKAESQVIDTGARSLFQISDKRTDVKTSSAPEGIRGGLANLDPSPTDDEL